MKRQRIKFVSEYQDRHGRWRAVFRKTGFGSYNFKHKINTPEFWAEYNACVAGNKPGAAPKTLPIKERNMYELAELYFQSPDFKALADSTKSVYRRMINHFLEDYGKAKVASFSPKLIYRIMQTMYGNAPSQANILKKRLRSLFHLAIFLGWRDTDPLVGVKNLPHKRIGFHTWSEDEIKQFEQTWASGTKPRLAFAIMLYTGLRRSDLVRLGRQHIKGGRIVIKTQKTGNLVDIPVHSTLQAEIDQLPADQMQFVLTDYGKPFTAAGFGNKMRQWCTDADLPGCTSHGLRKAISVRLYEAGATKEEVGAFIGDKDTKSVDVYIEEAKVAKLADRATDKLKNV